MKTELNIIELHNLHKCVALYVRVSKEDQFRHGYSFDSQIEAGLQLCQELKVPEDKIRIYREEGESGSFSDRTALQKLQKDIQAGQIALLVIYDVDRLGRQGGGTIVMGEEMEEAGVTIWSVLEGMQQAGGLLFGVKALIAKDEAKRIRERTMRGARKKAREGKIPNGWKGYGYQVDNKGFLQVIPEEVENIRKIFALYIENGVGYRSLTQSLADQGILYRKGERFSASHVRKMLGNELYTGIYIYGKYQHRKKATKKIIKTLAPEDSRILIPVPPIIDQNTFNAAQIVRQNNASVFTKNTKNEYLAQGIVRCLCGAKMYGSARNCREKTYFYYQCRLSWDRDREGNISCSQSAIRADLFDKALWDTLTLLAASKIPIEKVLKNPEAVDNSKELDELNRKKRAFEVQRATALKWWREGQLPPEEAEKQFNDIKREIMRIDNKIAAINRLPQIEKHPLHDIAVHLDDILNAKTFEARRKIIQKLGIQVQIIRRGSPQDVDFCFL